MQFIDAAPIAGTRRTADGYLVADVKTARTGIQLYAGREVGKPEMQSVKVYRSADQVFDKASLGSYAHKPVTNDHPTEAVTADTWKSVSVGQIGDEVARDGEFVRIPLVVMDAAAIKAIDEGKRELSAGYTCDLAWEPGTTPRARSTTPSRRISGSTTLPSSSVAAPDRRPASATVRDSGALPRSPVIRNRKRKRS